MPLNHGQMNTQNEMHTCLRYLDCVSREQYLVVWNPRYIPQKRETVEFMYFAGDAGASKDFQKKGTVQAITNFYDCNEDIHQVTIYLDYVMDVEDGS